MKAVTILQPWASLVVLGEKKYETRSWATKYRGRIAIHASKRYEKGLVELGFTPPFADVFHKHDLNPIFLPTGAVLGTADLVDCILITKQNVPKGYEFDFGNYQPHRYMWKLENSIPFAVPVPASGKVNIWEWDAGF